MDRTLQGFTAGMIASVPMNIINIILYHYQLTETRFIDWASIIMTGDPPKSTFDLFYSFFAQSLWSGSLGIIIAFLVLLTTSKNHLIKGVIFSFFFGFSFRGIVVLFQVHDLDKISTQTSALNFMPVALWGLTTMYILHWYEIKKY